MLCKLRRQWENEQREWHLVLALLRRDVINFSMRSPQKPVELEDIAPWTVTHRQGSAPRGLRMTKERRREIADSFRRTMQALME